VSRKSAALLRLLRGKELETVSRGLGMTMAPLSFWREIFLAVVGLKPRAWSGRSYHLIGGHRPRFQVPKIRRKPPRPR